MWFRKLICISFWVAFILFPLREVNSEELFNTKTLVDFIAENSAKLSFSENEKVYFHINVDNSIKPSINLFSAIGFIAILSGSSDSSENPNNPRFDFIVSNKTISKENEKKYQFKLFININCNLYIEKSEKKPNNINNALLLINPNQTVGDITTCMQAAHRYVFGIRSSFVEAYENKISKPNKGANFLFSVDFLSIYFYRKCRSNYADSSKFYSCLEEEISKELFFTKR